MNLTWSNSKRWFRCQVRPGGVKEGSHVRANECTLAQCDFDVWCTTRRSTVPRLTTTYYVTTVTTFDVLRPLCSSPWHVAVGRRLCRSTQLRSQGKVWSTKLFDVLEMSWILLLPASLDQVVIHISCYLISLRQTVGYTLLMELQWIRDPQAAKLPSGSKRNELPAISSMWGTEVLRY